MKNDEERNRKHWNMARDSTLNWFGPKGIQESDVQFKINELGGMCVCVDIIDHISKHANCFLVTRTG